MDIFYIMAPSIMFYNTADEVEWDDIAAWWSGDKEALSNIAEGGAPVSMSLEEAEYNILEKILGKPASEDIHIMNGTGDMENSLEDGINISIIAFDKINKGVKVLDRSAGRLQWH